MKLSILFSGFSVKAIKQSLDMDISLICQDARKVKNNSLFIAIRGNQVDGHQFIDQAIQNGCSALVVEDLSRVPNHFSGTVVEVANTRLALDHLACQWNSFPSRELFCVGVTGTNGKTSVTYMVEHILNQCGLPTGVIGTVNHHLLDHVWDSSMTTPDPLLLQSRLREFLDHKAQALAIEVSSHALDQARVESLDFDSVIFTNLTRDHLDYHSSMESYFSAKQRLFWDMLNRSNKKNLHAIINIDDEFGRRIAVSAKAKTFGYGQSDCEFQFQIQKFDYTHSYFELKAQGQNLNVVLPMSGLHNVYNSVAAIAAAVSQGLSLKEASQAMQSFPGVPGRLQWVVSERGPKVFIDYAHSPDALENVLNAIRSVRQSLKSQNKIWTVFGCGGDRDKGKRPLMAEVAARLSDHVMITSDNPRTEDPQQILQDIWAGIPESQKKQTHSEVDRIKAIEYVIRNAASEDVVLIAGKGHEDYQIIGTTKYPMSDYKLAEEFLK